MFISTARPVWDVILPEFNGIRIMMMPFLMHDPLGSLPADLLPWVSVIQGMAQGNKGVGYLTVDEALVKAGETHRRPGLHVDGVGPNGEIGGWGGGGAWGSSGMTMVSSEVGCRVWNQEFHGAPGPNGDCSHLADQLNPHAEAVLQPGEVWFCGALCVHEALPMERDTVRQFCRVSMPSAAPWYEGYTENPLGIKPTGPIRPARAEFMAYRP